MGIEPTASRSCSDLLLVLAREAIAFDEAHGELLQVGRHAGSRLVALAELLRKDPPDGRAQCKRLYETRDMVVVELPTAKATR